MTNQSPTSCIHHEMQWFCGHFDWRSLSL
jgi:hypothetical protein